MTIQTKLIKLLGSFLSFFNLNWYNESIDSCAEAVRLCKSDGDFAGAGEILKDILAIKMELDDNDGVIDIYKDMASCFKLAKDYPQYVISLENALQESICEHEFLHCTKISSELAEYYEINGKIDYAIELYEQIGLLFLNIEDQIESAILNYAKSAYLLAIVKKYDQAIHNYDICVQKSTNNVNHYIFKAMLCYIARNTNNIDELQKTARHYISMATSFDGSKEQQLIYNILQSIWQSDSDLFKKSIREYDSVKKFDSLEIDLLLRIKDLLVSDFYSSEKE